MYNDDDNNNKIIIIMIIIIHSFIKPFTQLFKINIRHLIIVLVIAIPQPNVI